MLDPPKKDIPLPRAKEKPQPDSRRGEITFRIKPHRDLFKKIRDTMGTFHAEMGTIKDRNGMDLTEAEDIKKKWQQYTGELFKKDLHEPDNQNGVITHLEPDILECKVKWAKKASHEQN